MSDPIFDIAVIGAGPAGLAAALDLARRGWQVALVAPRRDRDARTTALLGESVAFMRRIAAWPAMAAEAAPLRTIRIVDGTRRLIRAPEVRFDAAELGLDAFGYNVPNPVLVGALEAAAEAAGIFRVFSESDGIFREGALARVQTAAGAVMARLVVAADGRRSRTREGAGIAVRSWRYPQAALVTSFSHSRDHDEISTEFHTETGPFTLVPLPGRRSSLVWVETPERAATLKALPAGDLEREIERRSQALLGAITIDAQAEVFPLSGMAAARLVADGLALVGETAHVVPPIGAQGLNLALADIAVLGEALDGVADPGAAAALATYDRRRRADLRLRSTAVDLLNRSLLTDFLPVQAARGLGLFALGQFPALRRAVMRFGIGARTS